MGFGFQRCQVRFQPQYRTPKLNQASKHYHFENVVCNEVLIKIFNKQNWLMGFIYLTNLIES